MFSQDQCVHCQNVVGNNGTVDLHQQIHSLFQKTRTFRAVVTCRHHRKTIKVCSAPRNKFFALYKDRETALSVKLPFFSGQWSYDFPGIVFNRQKRTTQFNVLMVGRSHFYQEFCTSLRVKRHCKVESSKLTGPIVQLGIVGIESAAGTV